MPASTFKLFNSDNMKVMGGMKPNSIDAIITDTPYATDLAEWDSIPSVDQFAEMYRLAKPGAYIVAFGATRTHHRMMLALEQAKWEIRDMLLWLYGSGFAPGSANIAENIDRLYGEKGTKEGGVYTPSSEEAKEFAGFGVGLKPAWEPIVLARKPGKDTLAEQLVTYGIGALDITNASVVDGQISGATDDDIENISDDITEFQGSNRRNRRRIPGQTRWPANVAIEAEAVPFIEGISPGASRFFFCAKASPSEREAGCQHLQPNEVESRLADGETKQKYNNHPTVKPIALMRWLTRLVAPKGTVVLDPYMGSGSTGCAIGQERDRMFIGIEQSPEYFAIAKARIDHWSTI